MNSHPHSCSISVYSQGTSFLPATPSSPSSSNNPFPKCSPFPDWKHTMPLACCTLLSPSTTSQSLHMSSQQDTLWELPLLRPPHKESKRICLIHGVLIASLAPLKVVQLLHLLLLTRLIFSKAQQELKKPNSGNIIIPEALPHFH